MIRTPADTPQAHAADPALGSHSPRASPAAAEQQITPWLPVNSQPLVVIEHPCIIKNVDKGIKSLGGAVRLGQVSWT
jgi:general transcription factor 3C polypeptide 5 (transcription factor C subunit 1)